MSAQMASTLIFLERAMNKIDALLNKITMYRLVLYGLRAIVAVAFVYSAFGVLNYSLVSMALSLGVLLGSGFGFQYLLRRIFNAQTGAESWNITVLILFLILRPAESVAGFAVLILAVAIAMASKYLLAIADKHLFNPAAIALVALGLLGSGEIFWWIGTGALLPVVLVAGALIVRKIRRVRMVGAFVAAVLVSLAINSSAGLSVGGILQNAILSGPLVFFAAIMLTEPATSPPNGWSRIVYAVIVGLLYGVHFQVGPLHSSPELALVLGNLFAYAVSVKRNYRLAFTRATSKGGGVYEFAFWPNKPLEFAPGQYAEWTLAHPKPDSRGTKRYFTIASSPQEAEVRLSVKIDPQQASSYKKALLALQPGHAIRVAQISGDFLLPDDSQQKIVWIAGGIGITPFRSMARHLLDTNERRDITLFYCSLTADGFAYWQLFNEAVQVGVKPRYVITGPEVPEGWFGMSGFLTSAAIQHHVPDMQGAVYYLSGPEAMVSGYKKMLLAAGVARQHIKTDYFPGF